MTKEWIELSGAHGEGGGQILRSALALSMITGTPFRIEHIRAKRAKPGLLRQHLTAVSAAAEICSAEVTGAALGSQRLSFRPGPIRGGEYSYAIGSAGSAMLVLQTILPALWYADAPARITVSGGTHNPSAPPADFLQRCWLPLMQRMGAHMEMRLTRHGFYPAGGGEVAVNVQPVERLQPLSLDTRGALKHVVATAVVAAVPGSVAERELERLRAVLGPIDSHIKTLPSQEGPGNIVMVEVLSSEVRELFCAFGEKGLSAESVADQTAHQARQYMAGRAAVGEYLADQLALPLALAGGGSFTVAAPSSHLTTNLAVIEKFLPVVAEIVQEDDQLFRVSLA